MLCSDWLDLAHVCRIMFDFKRDDEIAYHNMFPVGGPWGLFSRMRIRASGQVTEIIDFMLSM